MGDYCRGVARDFRLKERFFSRMEFVGKGNDRCGKFLSQKRSMALSALEYAGGPSRNKTCRWPASSRQHAEQPT